MLSERSALHGVRNTPPLGNYTLVLGSRVFVHKSSLEALLQLARMTGKARLYGPDGSLLLYRGPHTLD